MAGSRCLVLAAPLMRMALAVGLSVGAADAGAQPFGFLFDDGRDAAPPSRRRAVPPRIGARAMPPDRAGAGRSAPPADPPLPEPRPHFAGDPPGRAPAAKQPDAQPPAEPGSAPARGGQAVGPPGTPATGTTEPGTTEPGDKLPASPPLPAPKPAELSPAGGKADGPGDAKPSIAPSSAKPAVAPSGATTADSPRQPAADPGCPARLAAAGIAAEPIALPPQPDARCTVAEPMRLERLTLLGGGTVEFPDRPTLSCTTAATFAGYVRELLAPLAAGSFAAGRQGEPAQPPSSGVARGAMGPPAPSVPSVSQARLTAVWTGPGLECRSRDHVFGAKLSAHGQGLAIDIAQLRLADGRTIAVGAPADAAAAAFETAARAGACGYFHTVLGPGSDSYHRTHWHFDLEVRGREGDTKYCH